MNDLIHLAFNSSEADNATQAAENGTLAAQEYTITFDPAITVRMANYNGDVSEVSLLTGLTWMQGNILNFFNADSLVYNDTSLLFYNYYNSIYPALESFVM